MNNRITELFRQKPGNVLNIYFTAGFPRLDDTVSVIRSLEAAGTDIVEIGIPYSDPLADGPTIQQSSMQALQNGMTLRKLFEQLEGIRNKVQIPLLLMGYYNSVMQYGMENFVQKAAEVGIDGVILPDMPLQEYINEYESLFQKHGLSMVFLVTPQTSSERLQLINKHASGFIYIVSTSSTTGSALQIGEQQEDYFKKISQAVSHPTLIGFGIRDHASFQKACQSANGAIIGSAFIKALQQSHNLQNDIEDFVTSIKSPQGNETRA